MRNNIIKAVVNTSRPIARLVLKATIKSMRGLGAACPFGQSGFYTAATLLTSHIMLCALLPACKMGHIPAFLAADTSQRPGRKRPFHPRTISGKPYALPPDVQDYIPPAKGGRRVSSG